MTNLLLKPRRHKIAAPGVAAPGVLVIAALAFVSGASLPAQSPIAPGAKPVNHGNVGAGEGPAWSPNGDGLYFSGGGNITRRGVDGRVEIFREQAGANGLLFDLEGRLVVCETRNRRVTRTERDGSITVLADQYGGQRFNQPNDLTIDSKGRIYFTDPQYGRRDGMEMRDTEGKLVEGVYRIDAPGKVSRIITHEVDRPNGILVSPDEKHLYVADNNNDNAGAARKLWRFDLKPDGAIDPASRRLIFDWKTGRGPDGFKMDTKGRLYVAGGRNEARLPAETAAEFKGGVYVLSPEGKLLEFIPVAVDEVTNCAFGGDDLKTLFITAGGTLWSIEIDVPGRTSYQRGK
jgi:gluconolactonase